MTQTTPKWENDAIQFPRLLAEIIATQDKLDVQALADSMDLSVDQIDELFDRANDAWEAAKAGTLQPVFTLAVWNDAYAAFKAAFDTPVMRRKVDDEYAEDARRRLAELNEIMTATCAEPAEYQTLDLNKMTRGEMAEYIAQQNLKIVALERQLAATVQSPLMGKAEQDASVAAPVNPAGAESASVAEGKLLVSLDGGESYSPVKDEVRVIYPKMWIDGEDEPGELHINLSPYSIVSDVWVSREEHLDHNIGTKGVMPSELVSEMIEAGA